MHTTQLSSVVHTRTHLCLHSQPSTAHWRLYLHSQPSTGTGDHELFREPLVFAALLRILTPDTSVLIGNPPNPTQLTLCISPPLRCHWLPLLLPVLLPPNSRLRLEHVLPPAASPLPSLPLLPHTTTASTTAPAATTSERATTSGAVNIDVQLTHKHSPTLGSLPPHTH